MKVIIDVDALRRAIVASRMTFNQISKDGHIAKITVQKALKGEAIQIAAYARLSTILGINLDKNCRLID